MFWKKKKPEAKDAAETKTASQSNVEDDDEPDESELEKVGFDPELIEEEIKEETLCDFSKDYAGYLELSREEILRLAREYRYIYKYILDFFP